MTRSHAKEKSYFCHLSKWISYERYAIWIESDYQNQLVYKHAISTIRL